MSIERAVRMRLLASSGVTALVGTRVMIQPLKQGLPFQESGSPGPTAGAISLRVVSLIEPTRTVDTAESLERQRLQVDCWARVHDYAAALERAVAATLNGFRGLVVLGSSSAVDIVGAFRQNRVDHFDPELNLHRVIADYFVTAAATAAA